MKKTIIAFFSVSTLLTAGSLQNANAQSWNLPGNTATGTSKLGTTNNFSLRFYTNDAQRMAIDSFGRVGIGTPAPLNLLTVQLNGSAPSASWLAGGSPPAFLAFGENQATGFNLATAANAAGYRPVLNTRRSRGTLAAPAAVINNDYLASFVSSGHDGSNFQNPATIDFYVDGAPSAGNVPARISFVTGSNATNRLERLKVGSTGNIYFNNTQLTLTEATGNVSIGTGNLIMGSSAKTIQFASPLAGSAAMMTMFPSGTANVDRMVISHSPSFPTWGLQYQDNSDKFNFLSGGTPVLTADLASRRVGIGTSAPDHILDVAGRIRVRASEGSAGAWFTNAASTANASFIGMANDNSVGFYSPTTGWGLTLNTASGYTGVGALNPAYRLDVAGRMRLRTGAGSAGTWLMNNANTADVAFMGMLNDSYVGLFGSGAGWGFLMNTATGNVGIGTGTPNYKLDVCGTIRAKEVRVETGWCDYVFEKDYKLRSIDELEKFITDNKHLPGIRPAAEVEKDGLKVGEMNKAMMEKIEELALYVIQLGKENKKLQQEIDSLKK